jgi:glycosyltransferase involved in cell wall biosynthesis
MAADFKPKLLIVSYLFPPNGGIAVQRALSLAKYLPDNGFEVHILKGRNAASPANDPSLLQHIPPCVRVHDAFTPEIPFDVRQRIWKFMSRPGKPVAGAAKPQQNTGQTSARSGWKSLFSRLARRIFCPEPEILWVPFAVRKARKIIRQYGIDAVLITAPPFSAFVAGTRLKQEFPHIKLIADFRDEWLTFYLQDFDFQNSPHTRRRAEEIERETIERSDLVVAVTESSLQEIRRRYPEQPDAKFVCLHNGYDPDVVTPFPPHRRADDKVIVMHVGTVYKTASPKYYLDALDAQPEEIRSRFETRFIGRISEDLRDVFQNRKTEIKLLGFMAQTHALQAVAEADYLLLTMTNDISLPGKLFEYLAMGRPILALSRSQGEVRRILETTRTGWCEDFNDPAALQSMLRRAAECAAGGAPFSPDWTAIRHFERPALTRRYGELIRSLWPAGI